VQKFRSGVGGVLHAREGEGHSAAVSGVAGCGVRVVGFGGVAA